MKKNIIIEPYLIVHRELARVDSDMPFSISQIFVICSQNSKHHEEISYCNALILDLQSLNTVFMFAINQSDDDVMELLGDVSV